MAGGSGESVDVNFPSVEPLRPRSLPPKSPAIQLGSLPGKPLLSVIVPSFNQAAFIGETINSALAQDYRPVEIIVVDGDSSDGTQELLDSYQGVEALRVLSEPDGGVCEAVNKGLHWRVVTSSPSRAPMTSICRALSVRPSNSSSRTRM